MCDERVCLAEYDLSRNSSAIALVSTYSLQPRPPHVYTQAHALSGGYWGYVGVGNENMPGSRFTGESNLTSGPGEIYHWSRI